MLTDPLQALLILSWVVSGFMSSFSGSGPDGGRGFDPHALSCIMCSMPNWPMKTVPNIDAGFCQ